MDKLDTKKIMETTAKEIKSIDDDLTLKQKAFLKRYFETGNGTQSALEVYDTTNYKTASAIASENLEKLRLPIKIFMEARGISLGKLVDVLNEGLQATRVISAVQTDKQANGATTDFIEVPDYATRHKYLTTASKWLGIEQEDVKVYSLTQNNNFIPLLGGASLHVPGEITEE